MMSTTIASPNRQKSGLTWGKALKGVALVAVVAVAAVATFYVIGAVVNPALFATLSAEGTLSAIAGTAVQGFAYISSGVVGIAGTVAQSAAQIWAGIPGFFGIAGNSLATPLVAANAAEIGSVAKVVGAGAAASVAAVAVTPHLKSVLATPDMPAPPTPTPHTDTSSAAVLSQMKTTAANVHHQHDMSHTAADMAKHAGEHAKNSDKNSQKLSPGEQPRRGWRDVFSNQQPSAQPLAPGEQPRGWSHKFTPAQNAASMASAGPRPAATMHAPRDPNFATQLDADRKNLRDILGEGGSRA